MEDKDQNNSRINFVLINDAPVPEVVVPSPNQTGEEEMAEIDTTMLSQEHGAIRHDIAVESARLGSAIGSEACAVNKHIGDARFESAENFGHTRADIQSTTADLRQENARNFADARYASAQEAADIRQEATRNFADGRYASAQETTNIITEGLKGNFETIKGIKDNRFDLSSDINVNADRLSDRISEGNRQLTDRFFDVGRDLSELRQGQATISKDIELNGLKGMLEGQKNTQYLSDKITIDGEKTRALLNDQKYHDLSRGLVERNTEIVNCDQDRRYLRDRVDDGRWNQVQAQFAAQYAQLQNQVQAFQSQLQETRQGMVNFGSMSDVGQSSTSNNVK